MASADGSLASAQQIPLRPGLSWSGYWKTAKNGEHVGIGVRTSPPVDYPSTLAGSQAIVTIDLSTGKAIERLFRINGAAVCTTSVPSDCQADFVNPLTVDGVGTSVLVGGAIPLAYGSVSTSGKSYLYRWSTGDSQPVRLDAGCAGGHMGSKLMAVISRSQVLQRSLERSVIVLITERLLDDSFLGTQSTDDPEALFKEARRRRRRRWIICGAVLCVLAGAVAAGIALSGSGGGRSASKSQHHTAPAAPPPASPTAAQRQPGVVLPSSALFNQISVTSNGLLLSGVTKAAGENPQGPCAAAPLDPESLAAGALNIGNCGDPQLFGQRSKQ